MWNRGGMSSALERAQAHLSGRRLNKTTVVSKDHYPKRYVSKETTKTSGDAGYVDAIARRRNSSQISFHDLSDLSLSSEHSVSAYPNGISSKNLGRDAPPPENIGASGRSRFLKKAPPHATATSQPPAPQSCAQPVQSRYVTTSQRTSQSTALSRLALLENQIRNRKQARDAAPSANRTTSQDPLERTSPPILSSSELSMMGKRFLKKTKTTSPKPTVAVAVPIEKGPALVGMSLGGSGTGPPIMEASRRVSLDSDEEDMRRLLGGYVGSSEDSLEKEVPSQKLFTRSSQKVSLPPPLARRLSSVGVESRSPPSHPRHTAPSHSPCQAAGQHSPVAISTGCNSPVPSPSLSSLDARSTGRQARDIRRSQSPVSTHIEVCSLEDLFPVTPGSPMELYTKDMPSDKAISEKSVVSDEFKINILSLDDLAQVGTLGKSDKKKKTKNNVVKETDASPRSFTKAFSLGEPVLAEVSVLEYESDFESDIRTDRSSGTEISEHLGDKDVSGVSISRDQSFSETSQRDYKYSSVSEKDSEVLQQDDNRTADSFRSSCSSSLADTITQSGVMKTRPPNQKSMREAAVQTQLDGLTYTWSAGMATLGPAVGMSYVDPTPVASHTISAEAVEALSAYSPAVFALNDMLRHQLALTKHFVQASRHLHSSLLQSLGPADYTYTTLEDTKEFIRCHRPPKLTVEMAMEEVLQEMRDYHYI
ncbi:hypothetical protein UPYG_G00036480 [Umbra pygmaea]|uniref:DUF4614 domain-containing protein n=1 Tax=Umbra pygmaea TaxID=75934 RepID=A0ABD0YD08_UMBPY